MIAKLYSDGELIGTCKIPSADISVIRFNTVYFVYNDTLRGFESAIACHVHEIEYTPKELKDPHPRLPLEIPK